jgi:hypothetical protein
MNRLILTCLAGFWLAPSTHAAPQTRQELLQLIAPSADESVWMQIPWETDLTKARERAAAEKKPLFLWEMDGHPLGCV